MKRRRSMQSPVLFAAFVALLVSIGLCVLVVLAAVMTDGAGVLEELLGSALLGVLCTGLWTAAAAVGTKRRSWRIVMAMATAAVAIGGVFVFIPIWWGAAIGWPDRETYSQVGATFLLLGGAAIHAGVFTILPGRGAALTILKVMTSGSVAVIVAIICTATWFEDLLDDLANREGVGFWALMGLMFVSSFLSIAGTVIVPIASLASSRRRHRSDWLRRDVQLVMACPRCGQRQSVPQGRSRCQQCRAVIIVELEEPRCECGYLLFELHGDTCPECGRRVDVAVSGTAQPSATE